MQITLPPAPCSLGNSFQLASVVETDCLTIEHQVIMQPEIFT